MLAWKNAGAIALAVVATAALWSATPSAEAGQRRSKVERVQLIRPDHTTDTDAAGMVKVRDGRRVDVMIVNVRRLNPRTEYEVRDIETDDTLASVRTNRRGRARVRLRASTVRKAPLEELPNAVGIFEKETDECVLETDEPIGDPPVEGFADYKGDEGHTGLVGLLSIPDLEMECFLLTMFPPVEEGDEGDEGDDRANSHDACPTEFFELMIEKGAGDELPLGVESARELAERAFEIRDGDGVVVLGGNLPAVDEIEWMKPFPGTPPMNDLPPMDDMPQIMLPPMRDGAGNGIGGIMFDFPEPEKSEFVLWIADEDGVLQEIDALNHIDFGDYFDDFPEDRGPPEFLGPPQRQAPPNAIPLFR